MGIRSKHKYWLGKKFSIEHRKRLSLSKVGKTSNRKGVKLSEETKKKLSISHLGKPAWNKGVKMSKESRCKLSKSIKNYFNNEVNRKKLSQSIKEKWKDREYREKCKNAQKGERSMLWKGGISYEPYSTDWTEELKVMVRRRDGYICDICKEYGKSVHHIDYNKKNCKPNNLITLCFRCHSKTNHNRGYWKQYFSAAAETK
jgi:NUMOD3 motif